MIKGFRIIQVHTVWNYTSNYYEKFNVDFFVFKFPQKPNSGTDMALVGIHFHFNVWNNTYIKKYTRLKVDVKK